MSASFRIAHFDVRKEPRLNKSSKSKMQGSRPSYFPQAEATHAPERAICKMKERTLSSSPQRPNLPAFEAMRGETKSPESKALKQKERQLNAFARDYATRAERKFKYSGVNALNLTPEEMREEMRVKVVVQREESSSSSEEVITQDASFADSSLSFESPEASLSDCFLDEVDEEALNYLHTHFPQEYQ